MATFYTFIGNEKTFTLSEFDIILHHRTISFDVLPIISYLTTLISPRCNQCCFWGIGKSRNDCQSMNNRRNIRQRNIVVRITIRPMNKIEYR